MEGKTKVYRELSLPVVGGGVGAAVVVVGFGLLEMHLMVHFPPLEGLLSSVNTWMLKASLLLALSFPFFALQALKNTYI